jgi:hypothetical protein
MRSQLWELRWKAWERVSLLSVGVTKSVECKLESEAQDTEELSSCV